MARHYRDLTPAAMARREAQFRAFQSWELAHRDDLTPGETLAAIGTLLEALPASARTRAISTEGVQALHRALAVLR